MDHYWTPLISFALRAKLIIKICPKWISYFHARFHESLAFLLTIKPNA